MRGVISLISVLVLAGPVTAIALDKTVVIDLEQSWHHGSSQIQKLSATLELSGALTRKSAFTAIIRGQILGPDELEPGIPDQDSVSPASKRLYLSAAVELELREFYVDVDFKRASLRLGKQQVVWGQADGLKLLDVVNPQDFREFILDDFDDSRIPLWMFNLELFLSPGDLQILWVPDTSMHNLPESGALFEITAPFANIPIGTPVAFDAIRRPDNIFTDSDFGLRLAIFQGGWDITLNYLYHYDDFPVIRKRPGPDGLLLSPSYVRTHTLGASASNAFGSFIVRTELVFNTDKTISTHTNDVNGGVASSREIGYVVGLDWSGLTDTFISVQLFQSYLLGDADYVRPDTDTNLTFLLRRNFMNQSINFEMLWIVHNSVGDSLLRLRGDYELTSNTSFSLYADFFSGKQNELFGQFQRRDQIGVKFTVGF